MMKLRDYLAGWGQTEIREKLQGGMKSKEDGYLRQELNMFLK